MDRIRDYLYKRIYAQEARKIENKLNTDFIRGQVDGALNELDILIDVVNAAINEDKETLRQLIEIQEVNR